MKDISELDEFRKYGETFKLIKKVDSTKTFLFERDKCYEIVRAKKFTNPDGSVVWVYPSSEQWGAYGLTVSKKEDMKLIDLLMSDKDWTPEHRDEIVRSLSKQKKIPSI